MTASLQIVQGRPAADWWRDRDEIAQLIRWLEERGDTTGWDAAAYARLVEKPWKWNHEHQLMVAEVTS